MEIRSPRPDDGLMSEKAVRRLERLPEDKVIAGVCSGIASYFGTNPTIVRVAVVFLTLVGWWTVLLYLAGWALMPEARRLPRRGTRARVIDLAGIVLLVVGTLGLIGDVFGLFFAGAFFFPTGFFGDRALGSDGGPGPFLTAAALVVVGMILLRRRAEKPEPRTTIATPARESTSAATFEGPTEVLRPTKAPASYALTLFTLAAGLLIVGTAALLSTMGAVSLDIGQLSALTLLLVGAGLLIGSWLGRSRLLIAIGILLAPLVLITSLINFDLTGQVGTTHLRPRQPEDLRNLNYAVGAVTLDLSRFKAPLDDGEVKLRVGIGEIDVLLPPKMLVTTEVDARAGGISFLRYQDVGTELSLSKTSGDPESAQRLELDIEGGLIGVQVHRAHLVRVPRREQPGGKDNRRQKDGGRREPRRDGKERR
jgi:phage shock protein PspC (stress-responsive transcriptional regulator)